VTSLSLLRLLLHDLRLSWRRMCAFLRAKTSRQGALIVAAVVAVLHVVAWPFATSLTQWAESDGALHLMAIGMIVVLPWLFSQGLTGATRALYSRGDLDLLFASPLSPAKILTSRALAVAIESFGAVGVFLLPISVDAALQGGASWLAIGPALAATALLTTGLALAATLGLFHLLGPRRTRSVGQVLATLVGAWFVICAQIFNFLPTDTREVLSERMSAPAPGGLFDPTTPWWLPARATAGEPLALLAWTLLGLAVFGASVALLGRAFARGALSAAGEAPKGAGGREKDKKFRCDRAGALRRKEWRLLARDPYLLSQVLLQSLYTLPIALVIWQALGREGAVAVSISPALVAIAAQLSAALAFLAASSEEAGDFVAAAPVAPGEILRRKLEAVAAPVTLFLAIPLVALAVAAPFVGFVTIGFSLAAAGATAALNFWKPLENRRGDLIKTHAQNKLVSLVEHGLSLAFAIAALLACLHRWEAILPVVAALALLWLNAPRKKLRTSAQLA
jgi:ABC-2 type transport system permease protein